MLLSICSGAYGKKEIEEFFRTRAYKPREVDLLCKEEVEQYQLATRPYVQIKLDTTAIDLSFLLLIYSFLLHKWCLIVFIFSFRIEHKVG